MTLAKLDLEELREKAERYDASDGDTVGEYVRDITPTTILALLDRLKSAESALRCYAEPWNYACAHLEKFGGGE